MSAALKPAFRNLARLGAAAIVVAALGLAAASFWSPEATWRALYFGAFATLHVSLGCASLLFIGDLSGGRWNQQLAPILNAGRLMIFVIIPILGLTLIGFHHIFPWTHNAGPGPNLFPLSKEQYLSPPLFWIRAALYAVAFLIVAFCAGVSARTIRARQAGERRSTTVAGCVGITLYAFTNIFFQTDMVMSLEPHWYSTSFPLIMMASQNFGAYALCLAARGLLLRRGGREEPYFGNLLIATLLFWAYVTFMQFLIIWMGNLTHDIGYYLQRTKPFWIGVSVFLATASFAGPLLLLLRPEVKLRSGRLGAVAALLAFCQFVFVAWTILPSWEPLDWRRGSLCALAAVGFAGLWLAFSLPRYGKEADDD